MTQTTASSGQNLSNEVQQSVSTAQSLSDALRHLLNQQGYPIDSVRMNETIRRFDSPEQNDSGAGIKTLGGVVAVLKGLGINESPEILAAPDPAFVPLLAHHKHYGWGVVDGQNPQGNWTFWQAESTKTAIQADLDLVLRLRLKSEHIKTRYSSFGTLLKSDLSNYKGVVVEAVIASFLINLLALAVSLFSMQVYDRVIPTNSQYTLIILASGVGLIIVFEAFMKFARSRIMDKVVVGLDQHLSREVFQRLLRVRIDQMPGSVGTMAAQLRGYEQVRSFFTASTLFGLVDIPMTIIFIALITYIGSPIVALVPVIAAVIALTMGLIARKRIDAIASEGAAASYYKTGLLVETVEGVETIKAGAGSWKFLSRWLDVMDVTVKNDLDMKHANDNLSYFTQMLQQVSYVCIVITGAFVVMQQDMTMGGLIACSILGGRVLAPVMNIPNLLVQYAHAKAARKNIENLFELEQDNHGVAYPLSPTKIQGNYQCQNLQFNYLGNDRPALSVPKLTIRAGERIAILGPIGSGKSTLLKLLSGLYAPTSGHILLDGLDIQQISRESMSEQVGYLQQDHRLFQGTLRENLLIGMSAPNDDVLQNVLQRTGLINLVANHSSGLDLPISEGGKGLSGGQKQLVAFTRLLLTKPNVMLIDEPTASMDNRQEQRCLQVLRQELQAGKTLIVATHKTALLDIVDRLIIMDNGQIVMDGAKEAVLAQLMKNEQTKRQGQASQVGSKPQPKSLSHQEQARRSAQHQNGSPQSPNKPSVSPATSPSNNVKSVAVNKVQIVPPNQQSEQQSKQQSDQQATQKINQQAVKSSNEKQGIKIEPQAAKGAPPARSTQIESNAPTDLTGSEQISKSTSSPIEIKPQGSQNN